jgi:hypothetical protein
MGLCKDAATTYLQRLGYNVVRHPREGIAPLQLIGVQGGETLYLGGLDRLLANPPGTLPEITRDEVTADIHGQKSSKLDLAIGVNILQSVLSAQGGNLGVSTGYQGVRTIQFVFDQVLSDSVEPLALGDYLRGGVVDADNLVLHQYVLGNGRLFVITRTVKTSKFTVKAESRADVAAALDVPKIQEIVSGNVKVTAGAEDTGTVSYEGSKHLVFGFQCFEVGVADGVLALMQVKSGILALAAESGASPAAPTVLASNGLLDVTW